MKHIPFPRQAYRIPRVVESLEQRRLFATINFAAHTDFAVGVTPVALVAADFTGNGVEDLAVADSTTDKVYIFLGNGTGAFTAGPILSLSSPPTAMITGDFNGDGLPDIAVASTAGLGQNSTSVTVFLNTGAGTFGVGQITTVETGATIGETVGLAAADFNRDGHLDLAVTDYTDENVSILSGNGNGTFASPVTYNLDGHPTAITSADFNNDTYPDLAITTTFTDNSTGTAVTTNNVDVLLGSSTGFSAGPEISLSTSGIPADITSANLTGVTTPGLIVGDSGGGGTLLTNTAGTFATSAVATLAAGSTAIATTDFDLDGNTDFVSSDGGSATSTSTDSVTVVQGAGNGSIGNTYQFSVGAHPADVVVADFNNDGKPDIATANELGGTVSILLNSTALPLISTTTALQPSATSTPAGSTLTLQATITPKSASPLTGEEVPTGTVDFYDGTTLLSSVVLASASEVAVYTTANLTIGAHTLRAKYLGDDAYALSTSAPLTETITPTATEGPDLVGTILSTTFPAVVAPGETGTIKVQLTNQGNTIASGTITNALNLSLDTLLDSADVSVAIHGSLARVAVHLQPGKSETLTGTVAIPQNFSLASYYFLISLNHTGSLAESVSTNDLVVSQTPVAVSDVFGTVDGRKNVVLTAADTDGVFGVFHLSGPGNGTLNVGDGGTDLLLAGTTAASSLSVTTARGQVLRLTDLTADSAVGKLSLTTTDLTSLASLPDGATSLALASTDGTITIGGGTISSLSLGAVTSASLNTSGGIKSLAVTNWDAGQITAPWIGSLSSKEVFAAGLQLSGSAAPGGVALNSATITGVLGTSTSNWNITGTLARLTAASFATGWVLDDSGLIKSLTSTGTFDATVNAGTISSIQVRGSATGATFNATTSIGSITIHGPVDSTTRFISPVLPKKVVVGGVAEVPTTDPRFET